MASWIAETVGEASAETVGVAIETPRGPVVESLLAHGLAVHSINPKQLDRFNLLESVHDFRWQDTGETHPALALQMFEVFGWQFLGAAGDGEGHLIRTDRQRAGIVIDVGRGVFAGRHVRLAIGRAIPDHRIVRIVIQCEIASVVQTEHGAVRRGQEHKVMFRTFERDWPLLKFLLLFHFYSLQKGSPRVA